jgi:flavodoxin
MLTASVLACTTNKKESTEAVSGPSVVTKVETSITEMIPRVEGAGKVLVVYFSQGNAGSRIANDIAALTNADIEVILEKKKSGGYFFTGFNATFGIATPIQTPLRTPAEYDVVFVCTPIWSWSLCPPVRSWLRMFKGKLPKTAYITVSGDTDPKKIVNAMIKESGREPFVFQGFIEKDFESSNIDVYTKKIAALIEPLRKAE